VTRYTAHSGWFKFAAQLFVGLLCMAAWLWWSAAQLNWLALQATPMLRVAYLLGVCVVGASLYFAVLAACGVKLKSFARRV
jgi:putative peptidoglycan lipid II flippase